MLIHILRNVGYDPVPEQAVFERCEVECYEPPVIIAGWYNQEEKKVYTCEPLIIEALETVSNIIPGPKLEMYFIYREVVRLHEHIHAYIHQKAGDFWHYERNVDEPITEFLSYCVIKNYLSKDPCYGRRILKLFEELPRIHPYDRWKDILNMYIGLNQNVKIEDLCKQIEKNDNSLKIIFRTFVSIMRTNPANLNIVRDKLKSEIIILGVLEGV